MKRITIVGLCLTAALAWGAVLASAAQAGNPPQCTFKLVADEPTEAFCEKTITPGVRLTQTSGGAERFCTAGPLLFDGDKTYLLTAGHCGKGNETVAWESQEPGASAKAAPVGTLKNVVKDASNDFGEIEIKAEEETATSWAEPFGAPNFDPVWANIAEWGQVTGKGPAAHTVAGEMKPKDGQPVCVEGFQTGEHCGKIITTKAEINGVKTTMVEVATQGTELGDSGAPWFYRNPTNGEVLIEGVHAGSVECDGCDDEGHGLFTPLEEILKNEN